MVRKAAYMTAAALIMAAAAPPVRAQMPEGLSAGNTTVTVEENNDTIDIEVVDIDALSDSYLDSLDINKDIRINDYTMIGIQYGVGLSQVSWNPTMVQTSRFVPYNFGILYTRYGKMFG